MKTFRTEEVDTRAPTTRKERNDDRDASIRLAEATKANPTTWPARFELLALASEAVNDYEWAAYWRARMKKCTDTKPTTTGDYSLPPGFPRWRALEIAGVGESSDVRLFVMVTLKLVQMVRDAYAPITPSMRTDAVDDTACTVEKTLARGLIRAAGGKGELRVDAADAEVANKVKAAWDNQWRRPPKSAELLGTARTTTEAERNDEAISDWGSEWRRPSKFTSDEAMELVRAGKAMNESLDDKDTSSETR